MARRFLAGLVLVLAASAVVRACPTYPETVPLTDFAAHVADALKEVEAFLANHSATFPGLIATAVYDQQIFWELGLGSNNKSDPQSGPPTLDSIVRVASITKVFTDLMALQLRDAGVLNLDDPVSKHYPEFSVINPYRTKSEVTLGQLASHTSGLTREIPYSNNETQILETVSKQYLVAPPSTRFHYSNLGIAVLGQACAQAAGRSYEDYIRDEITNPLDMTHAGFAYDDYTREHMAVGFDLDGHPAPVETLGWGNPCGGLFASARDMAKLVALMNRRDAPAGGSNVVDGTTLTEALSPVVLLRGGEGAVGSPWEMKYNNASQIWVKSKAGELPGYRSQISLVPDLKLGVFISVLQSDVPSDIDPTASVFTEQVLDILLPAVLKVLWAFQPAPVLPVHSADFVGSYGDGLIVVSQESNRLVVTSQGNAGYLLPFTNESGAAGGPPADHVLRLVAQDQSGGCRWLDDGVDTELIYFAQGSPAPSVNFMQGTWDRD